jgi:hypothetical protein
MGRGPTIACALALLAGCGGGDKRAAACESQPGTHYVTYRAEARGRASITPASLAATVKELCDRGRAAGLTDLAVRTRGSMIDIAGHLRPPARLAFYDWEPNLRPRSQTKPTLNLSAASRAASRQRGVVVIADEQRGYWTLADRPELTNADITDPKQEFDAVTGEPIVVFGFTKRGAHAFQRVTRREARRGARVGRPQTFAIVLDKRLVSRPQIDYQQNPNGLPGDSGAQINGFAGIQEAQDTAGAIASAPLPLDLVRVGSR